jgi:hypothetical protein
MKNIDRLRSTNLVKNPFKKVLQYSSACKKVAAFLIAFVFLIGNILAQTQTINTTGAGTFVVPAGVTNITVTVRGAGGGGGGNSTNSDGAGGGGGGGVARVSNYVVTPGSSISLFVGTGGSGGTNAGTDGTAGMASWFVNSTTLFANGGFGATGKSSGTNRTVGVAGGIGGGTISPAPTSFTGGNGGNGVNNNNGAGGGGGSSAGTAIVGNNGANATASTGGTGGAAPTGGFAGGNGGSLVNPGSSGSTPGGGGGGAGESSAGGTGGNGRIDITWTCPTVTSIAYTSPICKSSTSALPTLVGTAGGTYSSTVGLSIDPTTGAINASTSTAGTYSVTYGFAAQTGFTTNCLASTATYSVIINAPSVGGTASADQTICSGATPTALSLTGSTGTIQWQSSTTSASAGFTNISGETSSTLTLSALSATTWYKAVVTSGVCPAANSNAVTITVNPTSAGGTASADQTICSGATPTALSLTGSTGTIQWQSSTTSASAGFTDISGQTGATLTGATIGALTATTYYRAVVTSGVCAAANSNAVTITVNPTLTASISGAATICNGTTTTITFTGSPNTVVTYKIDAGADLTTTLNGAGTATITTAALSATTTTYELVSVAYATAPTCSQTITGQSAIVTFSQCAQRLAAKVFIHGAYNVSTGLMNDGLRTNDKIPTTQPYNTLTFAGATAYSGTETFDKAILATTGANAIVDWVLIELRDATTPATVVQRRAALLQSDGDVVDIDGISPVTFDALANGNYHVVIRHRLCLATRTQAAITFAVYAPATPTTSSLDFTGNSNALSGSQKLLAVGIYGLYVGDTDRNGSISTQDLNNIRARNPTTVANFVYDFGYDLDFNAAIFSGDATIVRANMLRTEIDLNQ